MEQRLKGRDVLARNNALIKEDLSKVEDMKLAYDRLESEDAKSLFLLCGLIGGTIPVETLFILGMGLGLFGEFKKTIQGSRNRFNTVLHELRSARLLLDGGDDNDNVTIDDLYSKVVISTRFTSEVVFSTRFTGENSLMMNSNCGSCEECWAIYLPDVGIDRFAELNTCQFPKLKILMFSPKNWIWTDAHPRDVEHHLEPLDFTSMKELQVLHIRFMRIAKLPSSIGILDNLCSLYLECCNVKDLTILGQLKALQILSFAWSTISRLPKEIGKLDKLKLLNLRHCNKLEIIDPDVLKGLTDLEELLMKGSFDQWMDKESCNAKLAELKSLKKLTTLEISTRDPTILLEDADLPLVNLIRFWINIGNTDAGGYEGLKKRLNIQNRPSVKHIASSSENAFTILESLCIHNLINLEKIYHDHVTSQCFIKLKVVIVTDCDQLEYLWCLSQMQILVELEEIEVRNCNSMQAIARKDIVSADNKVEPCYLRRLVLAELPKMTSFCRRAEMTSEGAPIQAGVVDGGGDEGTELVTTSSVLQNVDSDSFFDRKVSLPNLEDLELDSVGSFKRIWHDELSGSLFCKLATITVENCSDLLHIFPSTIIGRLHNLKSVKVENCLSLKSLFDCGSVDSNVKQATALLPALKSIDVKSCHSLESLFNCGSLDSNVEHINVLLPALEEVRVSGAKMLRYVVMSHSQIVLGFPSLETVDVENCSNLGYLFSKYTATTLMKLKRLKITKCKQMKEVILEKEAGRSEAEMMSFPCLSELTLRELDNLISFGSGSYSYYFSSLEDIRIVGCCNFGAFIPSPTSVKRQVGETVEENDESPQPLFNEMVTFPNITSLEINGLRCKEIWNNQIPTDSFQKLKSLKLKNCDNLQHIATSYTWKKLQRCLEKLEVISCRSINIIYEGDGMDTESSKLRRLVLQDLKNLMSIWQSDSLPNIPFPNLRDIEVVTCPHLKMLFPTFTAQFLGQIKELVVKSCEQMKQIAGHEKSEEGTSTTITFSELAVLCLLELPKFERFLPEKYSLEFSRSEDFPSLRGLSIESCGAERNQVRGDWRHRKRERE